MENLKREDMKKIVTLVFACLIAACSSKGTFQENYRDSKIEAQKGLELFAEISRTQGGWRFKDACFKYTKNEKFIDDDGVNYKLNRVLLSYIENNDYLKANSIKKCMGHEHSKNTRTLKYVNLLSMKPSLNTKSIRGCKGFWGREATEYCKINYDEYWEKEVRLQTLILWVAIAPAIFGMHGYQINFDWDAYKDITDEAIANTKEINFKNLTDELNSVVKSEIRKLKIDQPMLLAKWNKEAKIQKIALEKAEKEKDIARQKAEIARIKSDQLKLKRVKSAFGLALKADKIVGAEVCSVDNKFGYVEKVAGKRIKILLKGVLANNYEGYYLFKDRFAKADYSKKNEVIWGDINNWAVCDLTAI